ncbi:MAG TPA: group I intron-associated PD-(D/E)XK endonuclease [Terriglobales bacterium]|nr:group I intron-associated PD-(D/E)XK endonuclease [Terriglobales bacterium]
MPSLRTTLSKLKGEWAELQFMSRALSLGLRVGRIYGDSSRYDFLLDAGGRLSRVQVKSVWRRQAGVYRISAQRGAPLGKVPYQSSEVDFVIGYVVPEDAWYVVPARALARRRSFWVSPHRAHSRGRFEKYRDAWHLLGPLHDRFDLSASADIDLLQFPDSEQDSKTDGIREVLCYLRPDVICRAEL